MEDEFNIPYSIGRVIASNSSRHVTENNSNNRHKKNEKKQDNEKKEKKTIEYNKDRLFDSGDVNSLMDENNKDRIISVKI